jgi:transcriptional regulator with XRE-family HTH domain
MLHNLVPAASEMKIKLRSMSAAAGSTENDEVEYESLQDVSRNPAPELHEMQIPTSQFYSSASSDLNFSPTALAARDAQKNESRGKKSFGAVVAANVDRLRLAKGLALTQLAVSSTSINSWKQGTMRPSDNSLEKLARQFAVSIDELKTGPYSSDEEMVDLPTMTQSFKKQKVNIEEKVKTVQLKEAKDVVLKLQIQLAAAEAENERIRKMYDELFRESMVELERAYQSQIHILTKTLEANQPASKRAREE